jgi:hypothetical protein
MFNRLGKRMDVLPQSGVLSIQELIRRLTKGKLVIGQVFKLFKKIVG